MQQPAQPQQPAPADVIANQISLRENRNRALADSAKGLTLLNGGAAVALLAFLQAVWSDGQRLVPGLVVSLFLFLFGALLPSLGSWFRYLGAFHEKTFTPPKNPWWWAEMAMFALSAVIFLAGGAAAGMTVIFAAR